MDDTREEARRWVRRKRTFYTVVVIYLALSVLWFAIDMLTGTDDLWFYWPMLGAGLIVAVIGIAMFGVGGLFGAGWERREIEKYVERRGAGQRGESAQAGQPPSSDASRSDSQERGGSR